MQRLRLCHSWFWDFCNGTASATPVCLQLPRTGTTCCYAQHVRPSALRATVPQTLMPGAACGNSRSPAALSVAQPRYTRPLLPASACFAAGSMTALHPQHGSSPVSTVKSLVAACAGCCIGHDVTSSQDEQQASQSRRRSMVLSELQHQTCLQ